MKSQVVAGKRKRAEVADNDAESEAISGEESEGHSDVSENKGNDDKAEKNYKNISVSISPIIQNNRDNEETHFLSQKPPKQAKSSFTSAISRLLQKETAKKPILSKNTIESRIDEKKLESLAKKVIKQTADKMKVDVREIPVACDYDRQMRKIATRGVVKLFNAIRIAQKSVAVVTKNSVQKNDKQVPEVAKSKFMTVIEQDVKSVENVKNKPSEAEHPVPWMKQDFGMKTKHWDEDEEEE